MDILWIFYGESMDNLWIIYESGWWYTYPSEKYDFVNWDDDSKLNGKIKNGPNHQPEKQTTVRLHEANEVATPAWQVDFVTLLRAPQLPDQSPMDCSVDIYDGSCS